MQGKAPKLLHSNKGPMISRFDVLEFNLNGGCPS